MRTAKSLEHQLAELRKADLRSVRGDYRRLYGRQPPRNVPRALVMQAVAARLQQQLIARLQLKMQQALSAGEAIVSMFAANSTEVELVKEWAGRVYTATLVENGVLYNGRHHGSLSAVAKAITGRRIDGLQFFGIASRQVSALSGDEQQLQRSNRPEANR
jgi:hypothetical protein